MPFKDTLETNLRQAGLEKAHLHNTFMAETVGFTVGPGASCSPILWDSRKPKSTFCLCRPWKGLLLSQPSATRARTPSLAQMKLSHHLVLWFQSLNVPPGHGNSSLFYARTLKQLTETQDIATQGRNGKQGQWGWQTQPCGTTRCGSIHLTPGCRYRK